MKRAILFCAFACVLGGATHRLPAQRMPANPIAIIPVYLNGRLMPMDSYARIILKTMSGRTSIDGENATSWFTRLLFDADSTFNDAAFLVDNPEVLEALGFVDPERGRLSFEELADDLTDLKRLAEESDASQENDISPAERGILDLYSKVVLYQRLSLAFEYSEPQAAFYVSSPELSTYLGLPTDRRSYGYIDIAASIADLGSNASVEALSSDVVREFSGLAAALDEWREFYSLIPLPILPVDDGGKERWLNPWSALALGGSNAAMYEEAELLVSARDFHRAGNDKAYESAMEAFILSVIDRSEKADLAKLKLEYLFNRLAPFNRAMLFYIAGSLLLAAGVWMTKRWLPKLVGGLIGVGFTLHSLGIVVRVIITGRPPVTSLYTSFIFVSWLLVLLGLVWYLLKSNQIGLIVAAASGLIFIFLSGTVSNELDDLGVLQAVLDTNFWLGVHVLTIALGYAGCIAAGIIGHVYLIENIRRPTHETGLRAIYRALYAFLAFSLLFVFAGTMLGGIWADQSWGRFWGWDPKENGALLIIIWYSIVLHAKPARVIDQKGIAVGSVLGIIVVMFSWLGVNLMGIGLHSYGFTSGLMSKLIALSGFELLFASVAVVAARKRETNARLPLRTLVVSQIRNETNDSVTIHLRPKKGGFTYEAGMYVTLFLRVNGLTYRRPFSISSIASVSGELSITVRRIEDGIASQYLLERLKTGDKLRLAGPSGSFVLPDQHDRDLVFVAGGAGVAPIMGLIETALKEDRGGDIRLMYASRREKDIIFREKLDDLSKHHSRFGVDYHLSEPPAMHNGYKGRLTLDELSRLVGSRLESRYFVCGSEAFVDDMVHGLESLGVEYGRIRAERFTPAAPNSGQIVLKTQSATFELDGSSTSFKVKSGQSILDAGLNHGLPIRFSCAAGRCGDCLIRVRQGDIVSESSSVLTKEQTDQGYALACIAYPKEDIEAELPTQAVSTPTWIGRAAQEKA